MSTVIGVGILALASTAMAALLQALGRTLDADADSVVARIDALLPQTQCAQCGYPGCRPYAEAIARGDAGIDLCPPGGQETATQLAELLGRAVPKMPEPGTNKAFIEEDRCIGCALCIEACPVDAILGAPQKMHTVLIDECTGCELCLPACPVDCIVLEEQP